MKRNKEENKMSNSLKRIDSSQNSDNTVIRQDEDQDTKYKISLVNRARLNIKNRRSYNYKLSDGIYNIC